MIKISKEERLKLFKTAQDQLEVRIHNSKGTNHDFLVNMVFRKLDIAALCPNFIGAKKKLAKDFIKDATSKDVTKRVKARETVKKNRDVEIWTVNDDAGQENELKILCKTFQSLKKGGKNGR